MLNGSEYARVSNEVFLANNPSSDPLFAPAVVNIAGEGTNWVDEITRTGSIRWTPENTTGTVPGMDGILVGFSNNSEYIEDASFVRLKNITLGYTFKDLKGVSNFRIYGDVQNLLTLTPFKGTDPETDEFLQYPNAETYTTGLDVTF